MQFERAKNFSMTLTIGFFVVLAGIASAIAWKRARQRNRPWSFEKGILCSAFILVCTLGIGCAALYALSEEYSVNWSPDQTKRVVLRTLPSLHFTPQQSSDGPCIVEVYDAKGHCLDQIYFEMLQMAQVTWFDGFVEVGSQSVWFE
jgi:hypothetical protein